jgi:hypothetical protein
MPHELISPDEAEAETQADEVGLDRPPLRFVFERLEEAQELTVRQAVYGPDHVSRETWR